MRDWGHRLSAPISAYRADNLIITGRNPVLPRSIVLPVCEACLSNLVGQSISTLVSMSRTTSTVPS